MKMLENTGHKITKYKKGENVPHLEISEAIFISRKCMQHSWFLLIAIINKMPYLVNDSYQQKPRALHTFSRNKSFEQL